MPAFLPRKEIVLGTIANAEKAQTVRKHKKELLDLSREGTIHFMESARTQPHGVQKIPPQDPGSHLHSNPVYYDSHFGGGRPLPKTIFSQQYK